MNVSLSCPGVSRGKTGNRRPRSAPGMTLLELTVVILVLLSLVFILMIGGRAWKRGADRAMCMINLEQVQKAVRSFANLNNHQAGETVAGLESEVISSGSFIESMPHCPGEGTYSTLGDQIPPIGTVYLSCSLAASEEHEPEDFAGW